MDVKKWGMLLLNFFSCYLRQNWTILEIHVTMCRCDPLVFYLRQNWTILEIYVTMCRCDPLVFQCVGVTL